MICEPLVQLQNEKLHTVAVFREFTTQLEFSQLLEELNVVLTLYRSRATIVARQAVVRISVSFCVFFLKWPTGSIEPLKHFIHVS